MTRLGSLLLVAAAASLMVLVPVSADPSPGPVRQSADGVKESVAQRMVQSLTEEIVQLRREMAEMKLRLNQAEDDAAELRRFIEDHREYGDDFERYRSVREAAEREARQREIQAIRAQVEAQRAERRARREAARQRKAEENYETRRLDRYREAGFGAVGLDVFVGRMAFSYPAKDRGASGAWVDYDPIIGLYFRPGLAAGQLDFGKMTISGSVLNAAAGPRNIGLAITFFDENDNQVGSEIVKINNARPDVPYPFTTTLQMALSRPFSSSSTYVLYSDPVN